MRSIKLILLFLFNILLDLTVLSRFNINGYIFSITIPLIIILSLFNDNERIVYYAIFQGLLQDVIFDGVLGAKALFFYLIAYYTMKFDYKKNYSILYALLFLIISVFVENIFRLFRMYYTTKISIFDGFNIFFSRIYVQLIVSGLIMIIIYFIAQFIEKTQNRKYI